MRSNDALALPENNTEPRARSELTTVSQLPPPIRRYNLKRLQGIRSEAACVYRQARAGTLETAEATKFIYMLSTLGKLAEFEALELRIDRLEELNGNPT